MTMQGAVIEFHRDRLLIRDCDRRQQVIVHTPHARKFRPGDRIWIFYSGAMTKSIPPQISAIKIVPLSGIGPRCGHLL